MTSRAQVLLGGLWILGSGCVLPSPQSEPSLGTTGDTSEDASSTAPDPGGTSLAGSTTLDGTTGWASSTAAGSESEGSGTDGTTGDPGPASVCDPQPESAPSFVGLDFDPEDPFLDADEELRIEVACTVSGVAPSTFGVAITLDCEDAPHVLELSDLGPIDLGVGESVVLRAHDTQPWWRQTYVALLRDGELIVAGMKAESLPGGDGDQFSPPGTFFDPLAIEVLRDVCDPEPPPDEDPECEFLCRPVCTQDEREALRFTIDGQSSEVYDSGHGSLGDLELSVAVARHHVEVLCSDTPGGWYQFLVVRTQ